MSEETAEEWEFYPCQVEGSPASIFLNLAFHRMRPSGADMLYFAGLQILDPGEHGLGSGEEAKAIWQLEDQIVGHAAKAELTYVGRLRHDGDWQLSFYGAPGLEKHLENAVVEVLKTVEAGPRGYRLATQADPEWRYYREFLMPSAAQWRWILDRRVVQSLVEHGDELSKPRQVDHYLWFRSEADRSAFANEVAARGFHVEAERTLDEPTEHPFGLHLTRDDSVELETIHEVVADLIDLAERHGGDYDGWGAPVVQAE